jgi:hypothetical protein
MTSKTIINQPYSKLYYQENKEHLKEYSKNYKLNNKEAVKQYNKDYKEKHKDRLKIYNAEKITCNCGRIFNKKGLNRHLTSKIHFKNIN